MPSFALAGVARAVLVHGNDHRHGAINDAQLQQLVHAFINIEEPYTRDHDLRSFLLRVASEQFPYQALPFNALARSHALLIDAAEATAQTVLDRNYWKDLLGCPLEQFVSVAMLLYAGASNNDGRYNPQWMNQENFEPIFRILPRSVISRVADGQFVQSLERYRESAAEHDTLCPELMRYAFNPLLVGPFVQVGRQVPTAPVVSTILYRATPASLYYSAVKRDGTAFTNVLGRVFETYVGQQLKLCAPQELIHDFEYDRGKRAVDFIVVMPAAVILVEAKITPLTQDARLGGVRFDADYERAAGKGMRQIEHTAALIASGHARFGFIPRDRPVLGLVVTLEPYHACSNPLVIPKDSGVVPKWLANVRELEDLVSLKGKRLDEALLGLQSQGGAPADAIRENEVGRNSILDRAWANYPFVNRAPLAGDRLDFTNS